MKTKYEGKTLIATYEIKSSLGEWNKREATINSQEELNELIRISNKYMETFNLIDIQEARA